MKNKVLSILLSFSVVATYSFPCFADVEIGNGSGCSKEDITEAERIVEEANDIVDLSGAYTDIIETKDSFDIETDGADYEIPKDGGNTIEVSLSNGVRVDIGLPEELDLGEGVVTDDGSVVYQEENDTDVITKVITEEIDGEDITSSKTSVIINNADAPHSYTYNIFLPDGYSLMTDEEYNRQQIEQLEECKDDILAADESEEDYLGMISGYEKSNGEIYVVDGDGLVRQIVKKPWAKDADGNEVATRYEIDNDSIIQVVEFDESSQFPIIADPTVGETKPWSKRVSNATMGLPYIVTSGPLTATAIAILKSQAKSKILAVVGSKLIPGVSIATWVTAAVAGINMAKGNDGIQLYGTMIYRKQLTSKGTNSGTYVEGWAIKSLKAKPY